MCKGPKVRGSKVHLENRKGALVPGPQGARGELTQDEAAEPQRVLGPHGDFGLSPKIPESYSLCGSWAGELGEMRGSVDTQQTLLRLQ